jgi:hypothetical protein
VAALTTSRRSDLARRVKALPLVRESAALLRTGVHDWSRVSAQRQYANCLLLNTMRKSGSHYLMAISANYLLFTAFPDAERFDFTTMKEDVWSWSAWTAPDRSERAAALSAAAGYRAFVQEHENPLIAFNNARTIVHLYRNPLDALVSRYFYLYVNRVEAEEPPALSDVIDREIPGWAWHYDSVRRIGRRANVRRECYERLVREPAETAAAILSFAGLPVDEDVLARAVESSSTDKVRSDESRLGLTEGNVVGVGMTTSFIRSGAIGEWKERLAAEDVARVERLLHAERISLDEFVLE